MLNNIQKQQLDKLLDYYFEESNFRNIHRENYEGYKWRALRLFTESGVKSPYDSNFFDVLKEALTIGDNFLYHTNKDTLLRLNMTYKKEMRNLFYNLSQGEYDSLEDRIVAFMEGTDELRKRDSSRKWQKLLACDVMVCLAFLKPDEYYFYRSFVMDTAYEFLNGKKYKGNSAVKKACDFHMLCEDVLSYITTNKSDLLEKYRSFLESDKVYYYQDDNNHLLVQNILYALQYDKNLQEPIFREQAEFTMQEHHGLLTIAPNREGKSSKKRGKQGKWKYNPYKEMQIKKKQMRIGKIGEDNVYDELKKLYGLSVQHVSETDDSLHYDICYKDEKGQDIYVEVKTCSRVDEPRIYISQAEVEMSHEMKENYHIYIVLLDEKGKRCDYEVFKGDVTDTEGDSPLKIQYSKDAIQYALKFNRIVKK